MQISNILQQPASMAVPKCITAGCTVHLSFFTVNIPILGADADGMVGS